MRRRNVATVIGFAGFALIVVALVGSLGAFVYREMGAMRQRDALNLLNYFQQAMVTKLYDEVSPVDDLAAAFEVDPDDEAWFPRVAGELLEREEVSYVAYVRGDTMAYAYPEEELGIPSATISPRSRTCTRWPSGPTASWWRVRSSCRAARTSSCSSDR